MCNLTFQRRAMTLIEVLAATVLLAILSSVCATLLSTAPSMSAAESKEAAPIDLLALERAADRLLDEASLRERLAADWAADFTALWPDEADRPPLRIRSVLPEAVGDGPTHAWIAFSCGDVIVWRCIDLPREIPSP